MSLRAVILSLAVVVGTFPPIFGQAGTGVIAGRLISADLGSPVRKAQVRLTSASPRATLTATTDGEGRFSFPGLVAGEYTLAAVKPGYLEMSYGAQRTGANVPGTPITLAPGQRVTDIAFRLPRGGVISGVVTDEFGDPAFGVPVRAMRFSYENGQRTARAVGNATTDDLGAYRIAGLPPGDYAVSAVPREAVATAASTASSAALSMAMRAEQLRAAGRAAEVKAAEDAAARRAEESRTIARTGYVATYYPGAASPASLGVVRVGLSQQLSAVDLQLQVLRTSQLGGIVTLPDGTPTIASVQLIDPAMPVANLGVWFRHTTADGRFSFVGLPPGSYVLRAQASAQLGSAGNGELTFDAPVLVAEGTDQDIAVRLQRGYGVSGMVRLDTLAGADVSKLAIQFVPILGPSDWEMPSYQSAVDADGQFAIANVPSGRYLVRPRGLPETWTIDSALFDNRDAADLHLEIRGRAPSAGTITFTSQRATVSGTLTNADGRPVMNHSVLLFPPDNDLWVPQSRRVRIAQPGPDGAFTITALPPGRYRLAAVAPPEAGEQFDPEFLGRAVSGSVEITLGSGERKHQDLRIR